MTPDLRLGIDIDGVLADFNAGYRQKFFEVTGTDLFRGETDPPCWHYHTHYGYTDDDMKQVWALISNSSMFWERLQPYDGVTDFLRRLNWLGSSEVYFITTRVGKDVKAQTEAWLNKHGFPRATVLINRGSKGALAAGLGLTHVLDDRPENLFELPKGVRRYLKTARYNEWARGGEGIIPVSTLSDFVKELSS